MGIDGGSDGTVTICGSTFSQNSAGALGGALARTPDMDMQATNIDRCTFDGNTAVTGGGAMYMHNSNLNITGTTFSSNSAPGAGAIQADGTVVAFVNDTFAGNSATMGLGGAMSLFGNGGTIQNCTFANNHSDGGSGLFAAAIAGGTALTIDNSLFADNTSMDCGAPMTCQDGDSGGTNDLQWPQNHIVCTTPDTACSSGTTFADPALGMLADNGGPTKTFAPAAASPAAGLGKGCPAWISAGSAISRRLHRGCVRARVTCEATSRQGRAAIAGRGRRRASHAASGSPSGEDDRDGCRPVINWMRARARARRRFHHPGPHAGR